MERDRRPISPRARDIDDLEPGEVISASKEEQWTTQKKKLNTKVRQVQTKVQRQIVLEDGVVIADSGPKVSTHTNESDHSEDTDDEAIRDYRVQESDTLRRLRSDPAFEELHREEKVMEEHVAKCNVSRQKREEHFRFEDHEQAGLDGDHVHRLALEHPQKLLEHTPGFGSDQDGLIRGKLMYYESRGMREVDRDELHEQDKLDEHGVRYKERTRNHEHELMHEDELPERVYDNEKYVEELRELAGPHFDRIPAKEYSAKAVRLPYSNDREPVPSKSPLPLGSPRTPAVNKYASEKTNLSQQTHRMITFEPRRIRAAKEDASVQACFLSSDESDEELPVKAKHVIPLGNSVKKYYFGEEDTLKPSANPKISHWSSSTQYELRDTNTRTPNTNDILNPLNVDINNNVRNESYTTPRYDNSKYAYEIKDEYSLNDQIPIGNVKATRLAFENSGSNKKMPNEWDIPLRKDWSDKSLPARPFTDLGHYRSTSSFSMPINSSLPKTSNSLIASSMDKMTTSFGTTKNGVKTNWPEFSPLSSPSELLSKAKSGKTGGMVKLN